MILYLSDVSSGTSLNRNCCGENTGVARVQRNVLTISLFLGCGGDAFAFIICIIFSSWIEIENDYMHMCTDSTLHPSPPPHFLMRYNLIRMLPQRNPDRPGVCGLAVAATSIYAHLCEASRIVWDTHASTKPGNIRHEPSRTACVYVYAREYTERRVSVARAR